MVLKRARAFTLVELVIVVVILGIIAAIAIPRMSRGARGAVDSKLKADLAVLRAAINMFAAEHNGNYPSATDFVDQMTLYSDLGGDTNATRTAPFIYGPYLEAIPVLQIGEEAGSNGVGTAAGAGIAWIYNATSGRISANTGTLTDDAGVLYSDY